MWGSRPQTAACRLGEQRGQEILAATADLLLEVGYDRLTFDAVASRARASKATLYRHWPTKVDLVGDVLAAVPHPALDLPDTGTLAGDLHAFADLLGRSRRGNRLELFAAIGTAARLDDQLAERARGCVLGPLIDDLVTLLDRACARGELPQDTDTHFLATVVPALVMFHTCLAGTDGDRLAVVRRAMDDVVIPLASGRRGPAS